MRNQLFILSILVSPPVLSQDRYSPPTEKEVANAAISQFIANQPPNASTTVIPMGDTGVNTIYTSSGNYTAITNSSLNTTTITSSSGRPVTTCITSPLGVTTCN